MPRALATSATSWSVVVSSKLTPSVSASSLRRFTPRFTAAWINASARPGTSMASVSKNRSLLHFRPAALRVRKSLEVFRCVRKAI